MKIVCWTKSRPCELVVALSIFVLSCAAAQAQPQSHRAVSRPMPGPPHGPPAGQGAGSARGPAGQSSRERWLAMPPEARQNFRRNADRWAQMSPEERNVMRQRENLRRQTIQRETEAALRDSGLHLSPQERAQFQSRYIQERRKVEQALRQQIETERQKEIPSLIQQLRKEFQIDEPGKSPVTKPAASPKSGK